MNRFDILLRSAEAPIEEIAIETIPPNNWVEFYDSIGFEDLLKWMNPEQILDSILIRNKLTADTLTEAFCQLESRNLIVCQALMNASMLQKIEQVATLSKGEKISLWGAEVFLRNAPDNHIILFPEWNPLPSDDEYPSILVIEKRKRKFVWDSGKP